MGLFSKTPDEKAAIQNLRDADRALNENTARKPAQDRDDSIVYFAFAGTGFILAALLGRELYGHHLAVTTIVFAFSATWTGIYMSLGHLWAAGRRAKTATEDQHAEH